jgi:inner membrane transporter RhtA
MKPRPVATDSPFVNRAAATVPPQAWFGVSAIFHYLGPSFAVLLFPAVGVLGVAWFRIASAAAVFASLTRTWKTFVQADTKTRALLVGLGLCLAVMNVSFYLALDRLPMSLVAAMEFIGTIAVPLYGLRTRRNFLALMLAVAGVFILIDVKWETNLLGLFWSALNAALFVGYIVLGHKAAQSGASGGVERLGAAMLIAFVAIMPIGAVHPLRLRSARHVTATARELRLAVGAAARDRHRHRRNRPRPDTLDERYARHCPGHGWHCGA